jgi:DNA polymerase type B, organellar and viral
VYDIETEGFGSFLVGGLRKESGTYEDYTWQNEDGLTAELGATRGTVWAHNGGNFDHKWFLQRARVGGAPSHIRAAGGRLCQVRTGKLRLLDSKALTKISLRDLTKGLRVEKMRQPLPCQTPERCGTWCEGYCRFKRSMPTKDLAKVREYLRADCDSLFEAMGGLIDWAEREDLDLTGTVGGASWANAKRLLDLPDADLSLRDHLFARRAYYGGRVQIFRPRAPRGREYDVNALYPAALANLSLPWGTPTRRHGPAAGNAYREGREGIFRVRVAVPEMWIPPLPVRTRERSAYPTGVFSGVYCANELRHAELLGTRILEITEALVWPESKNVFRPWIEKLWALRFSAEGGKSGPFGTFLKFYMNSLTGKLGMKPGSTSYVVNPKTLPKSAKMISPGIYSYPGPLQRKRNGKWVAGNPCCHVPWAAYLTAWGRIRWHEQASWNGGSDLCMGDTDSVFVTGERTERVGDSLGEWQDKGGWSDLDAMAPKFYRYRPDRPKAEERLVDGFRIKSKGVRSDDPDDWRALWAEGTHQFEWSSPQGFRSAARAGPLFSTQTLTRTIGRSYGDRILDTGGFTTRPPTAKEIGL